MKKIAAIMGLSFILIATPTKSCEWFENLFFPRPAISEVPRPWKTEIVKAPVPTPVANSPWHDFKPKGAHQKTVASQWKFWNRGDGDESKVVTDERFTTEVVN